MCPCMREYMRADAYVCLCVGRYVYTSMCVCPNEGLIGTLCACCETCQTILASWKSASVQKVSQTDRMLLSGS